MRLSWVLLLRRLRGVERTSSGALQFGARDPVVADGVEVVAPDFDLLSLRLQKLEDAEEHGVVAELRFLHCLLPQRQEHRAVVLGGSVCGDSPTPKRPQ